MIALECVVKAVVAGVSYVETVALINTVLHTTNVVMTEASFHGLVYQLLGECWDQGVPKDMRARHQYAIVWGLLIVLY